MRIQLALLFAYTLAALTQVLAFNASSIAEELSFLPEEDCMSLAQLREVVSVAAFNSTSPEFELDGRMVSRNHSTVILTTCDLKASMLPMHD